MFRSFIAIGHILESQCLGHRVSAKLNARYSFMCSFKAIIDLKDPRTTAKYVSTIDKAMEEATDNLAKAVQAR